MNTATMETLTEQAWTLSRCLCNAGHNASGETKDRLVKAHANAARRFSRRGKKLLELTEANYQAAMRTRGEVL